MKGFDSGREEMQMRDEDSLLFKITMTLNILDLDMDWHVPQPKT